MSTFPGLLTEAFRDRYTIERELGRGGMATVYLARDLKHHRSVALTPLHEHPRFERLAGQGSRDLRTGGTSSGPPRAAAPSW